MFRKKGDANPTVPAPVPSTAALDRITSVLSAGINWKGNLGGSGGVRIEGTFEGDIAMRGLLVVGETGRVTCQTLRANTVIVAGAVKGDITAERLGDPVNGEGVGERGHGDVFHGGGGIPAWSDHHGR